MRSKFLKPKDFEVYLNRFQSNLLQHSKWNASKSLPAVFSSVLLDLAILSEVRVHGVKCQVLSSKSLKLLIQENYLIFKLDSLLQFLHRDDTIEKQILGYA